MDMFSYLRNKRFEVVCPYCHHREVCVLLEDGEIYSLDSHAYISRIDKEGNIMTLCLKCKRWSKGVYIGEIY